MRPIRLAFCGASGTGKTTLATRVGNHFGLPLNPVGSRSVARSMGYALPYDVDAAGKRGEFQHKLVQDKRAWEDDHESFVTDRTTLDNLVYTVLHDVSAVDAQLLGQIIEGLKRYTHIGLCPVSAFCNIDGDPNRLAQGVYHEIFEAVLEGLLRRYTSQGPLLFKVTQTGLDSRVSTVLHILESR